MTVRLNLSLQPEGLMTAIEALGKACELGFREGA